MVLVALGILHRLYNYMDLVLDRLDNYMAFVLDSPVLDNHMAFILDRLDNYMALVLDSPVLDNHHMALVHIFHKFHMVCMLQYFYHKELHIPICYIIFYAIVLINPPKFLMLSL